MFLPSLFLVSGDCKTLMICSLSPRTEHTQESLSSLRFAEKVSNCDRLNLCSKCHGAVKVGKGGGAGKASSKLR